LIRIFSHDDSVDLCFDLSAERQRASYSTKRRHKPVIRVENTHAIPWTIAVARDNYDPVAPPLNAAINYNFLSH